MDVAAARHNDGPPGSSPNTTAQKIATRKVKRIAIICRRVQGCRRRSRRLGLITLSKPLVGGGQRAICGEAGCAGGSPSDSLTDQA
jgi:hypothetical protein